MAARAKPYVLRGEPTAKTVEEIDEMLDILFRDASLTVVEIQATLDSLADEVAALASMSASVAKIPGWDGVDGADGFDGVPGPTGARGPIGEIGPPGFDGEDGADGLDGLPSTVGSLPTSGTYTPTLTNVANLDASTAYACQWIRVVNVVTVSGKVDVDPTLTATATQLGVSLPFASNIGNDFECCGAAAASGIVSQSAAVLGDAVNNRAEIQWISGDVTNQPMYFTFTYQVL